MPTVLLAEMLKKRKMTRYRFAKLLNKDSKNLRRFLRPEYDPKLSVLAEWAKVLRCKIKDLYRD